MTTPELLDGRIQCSTLAPEKLEVEYHPSPAGTVDRGAVRKVTETETADDWVEAKHVGQLLTPAMLMATAPAALDTLYRTLWVPFWVNVVTQAIVAAYVMGVVKETRTQQLLDFAVKDPDARHTMVAAWRVGATPLEIYMILDARVND